MIYYFSATGNSKFIAGKLASKLNTKLCNIADFVDFVKKKTTFDQDLENDDLLGIVCPVHSWGAAIAMEKFLKFVRFKNLKTDNAFCVLSCGDNCGNTDKQIRKLLSLNKLSCDKIFSVQMPNTYIVMKGFGLDGAELQKEKISNAHAQIDLISQSVISNNNYTHYVRGTKPGLKTGIVYPLFKVFATDDKKFFADQHCAGCGLCVKLCPQKNITSDQDNKPVWNGDCLQCLACIHHCPEQAIQFGTITQNQGRYFFKNDSGKSE